MGRQSRRKRDRQPRKEGPTLFTVVTVVDQTDEELVTTARNVAARSHRDTVMVAMVVHGYDHDPRELHEIPEVVTHMRRLVDFGFISILTRSSTMPALGGIDMGGFRVFGALEAWAFAEGMFSPGGVFGAGVVSIPMDAVKRFTDEVFPAAGEALRRNMRRFPDAVANPNLILEGEIGADDGR
jgi:hypothetical protein